MAETPLPTPKRLRQAFEYCEDGRLKWRRPGRGRKCSMAGSVEPSGYIRVSIDGVRIMAHRVVWAMHYGEYPKQSIDHINGDRADNRISNLRDVSVRENARNRRPTKRKYNLPPGVYLNARGFQASIRVGDKWIGFGTFPTIELARKAYEEGKLKHGFHPNHMEHVK